MKGLHNLKKSPRSTHRKKRLGRGNASGTGTYSGRGIKGQKARAGGKSGLTARSMKPYLLRIPKARGFSSNRAQYETLSVGVLQRFQDNSQVKLSDLKKERLIRRSARKVKILSGGEMTKKLMVEAHFFSAKARSVIESAGGSVSTIEEPKTNRGVKNPKV